MGSMMTRGINHDPPYYPSDSSESSEEEGQGNPPYFPEFSGKEGAQKEHVMSLSEVQIMSINLCRGTKLKQPELLFEILEYADYTTFTTRTERLGERGHRSGDNENRVDLLLSLFKERAEEGGTLSSLAAINSHDPVKVCVTCESHDQGWSSYPHDKGKRNSHTWGEVQASIKRIANPSKTRQGIAELPRYRVYRNLHAVPKCERHECEFTEDTALLRQLTAAVEEVRAQRGLPTHPNPNPNSNPNPRVTRTRDADTIIEVSVSLFARSAYPGWRNHMKQSCIEVTWRSRQESFVRLLDTHVRSD
jgi:hypothetical protein